MGNERVPRHCIENKEGQNRAVAMTATLESSKSVSLPLRAATTSDGIADELTEFEGQCCLN